MNNSDFLERGENLKQNKLIVDIEESLDKLKNFLPKNYIERTLYDKVEKDLEAIKFIANYKPNED